MAYSVRRPYLDATVINQVLLDNCQDNLECRLEFVADIQRPDSGYIRASDRNKYVGDIFYEAIATFPIIKRTVGEWLAPEVEFSQMTIELSNVDGRFNSILPGGSSYSSFIGKTVVIRLGLAESASTYREIFKGKITDVAGVSRTVKSITITARDKYDDLNRNFPTTSFSKDVYPYIDDSLVGKIVPLIYGDYTVALDPDPAIVKAFPVNSADPAVNGGTEALPNPTRLPVRIIISQNDLSFFDSSNVYLIRNNDFIKIPNSQVTTILTGNRGFSVIQNSASWVPNPDGVLEPYLFESSDEFAVRVKGQDLGSYDDNIIEQARHILMNYAGMLSTDFHPNWNTLRDLSGPSQNSIFTIKSRVYVDEIVSTLNYTLSMLEQVRIEAFIDKNGLLKLLPLHFDQFVPEPAFRVYNWDVVKDTFNPTLNDRNNFNRAKAAYDFRPNRAELARATKIYKNQASLEAVGRSLESKILEFPNLYVESDVINQLSEILKLSSALFEEIFVTMTWRSMLLDIGDFVAIDVKIGSTIFSSIPCLIREIGYDPKGVTIPMRLWSFQLVPFQSYTPPQTSGVVGGISASITAE